MCLTTVSYILFCDLCILIVNVVVRQAASDVYSPVNGSVSEVNNKLVDEPQMVSMFRKGLECSCLCDQINKSPYGDAWLMKVKYESADEVSSLMDKSAYDTYCEGLSH